MHEHSTTTDFAISCRTAWLMWSKQSTSPQFFDQSNSAYELAKFWVFAVASCSWQARLAVEIRLVLHWEIFFCIKICSFLQKSIISVNLWQFSSIKKQNMKFRWLTSVNCLIAIPYSLHHNNLTTKIGPVAY